MFNIFSINSKLTLKVFLIGRWIEFNVEDYS